MDFSNELLVFNIIHREYVKSESHTPLYSKFNFKIRDILAELKTIITTPLRLAIHDTEDIPSQFTRVLKKVYTLIQCSNRSDIENLTQFLSIAEATLRNHSFTDIQKENIRKWKEIIQDLHQQVPKVNL